MILGPLINYFLAFPSGSGYAMSPTIVEGQQTVVYRKGKIKRFSNVYFRVPSRNDKETNIRRIIGFPGEHIIYKEDVLYVNGEEIVENFLARQLANAKEYGYILTEDFSIADIPGVKNEIIPAGYYLVLGDNREFSVDSRSYGLVPVESIIGTVEMLF